MLEIKIVEKEFVNGKDKVKYDAVCYFVDDLEVYSHALPKEVKSIVKYLKKVQTK